MEIVDELVFSDQYLDEGEPRCSSVSIQSIRVSNDCCSKSRCDPDILPGLNGPNVRQTRLSTPSTTPLADGKAETFEVIHPFHPLSGQVFELVTRRCNWGENRVYYHDEEGILCSIPQAWTSLAPVDPFVKFAGGRSAFRVTDLLELARLVAYLTKEHDEGCDA